MKNIPHLLLFYFLFILKNVYAENPINYLYFSTDFAAKCVTRGGVMIYLSNTHPSKRIKVTLERWYMGNKTADRGRTVLKAKSNPDPLGCSKVSEGKQEWKILKAEWVK